MTRTLPRFVFSTVLAAIACGCGGQPQKGSPNDPNEQQGNANAQPEKSAKTPGKKQPNDNQAGRDAHTGIPDGARKQ